MEIQVKYLTDIDKVGQAHPGEWIDLRCAEDIRMWKGDFRKIPIGELDFCAWAEGRTDEA